MLRVLQQRGLFHFFSGSDRCRRAIRTSVASLCEVSEELKQDGGSSRGSGVGVGTVVPKATSGRTEHKHKEPFHHISEGLILVS